MIKYFAYYEVGSKKIAYIIRRNYWDQTEEELYYSGYAHAPDLDTYKEPYYWSEDTIDGEREEYPGFDIKQITKKEAKRMLFMLKL